MSMFDEILRNYGDKAEEWDEETQKNWDEKMSDSLKDHNSVHDEPIETA